MTDHAEQKEEKRRIIFKKEALPRLVTAECAPKNRERPRAETGDNLKRSITI